MTLKPIKTKKEDQEALKTLELVFDAKPGTKEGDQFESAAHQKGLYTIRRMALYSRQEKPQERWLYEFKLYHKPLNEEKLIIHGKGESRSSGYVELTREFYL